MGSLIDLENNFEDKNNKESLLNINSEKSIEEPIEFSNLHHLQYNFWFFTTKILL